MLTSSNNIIAELFANTAMPELSVNESDNDSYFVSVQIAANGTIVDTSDYDVSILAFRPDNYTYQIDVEEDSTGIGTYKMIVDNNITAIPGVHNLVIKLVSKINKEDITYSLPFRVKVIQNDFSSSNNMDFLSSIKIDLIGIERTINNQESDILSLSDIVLKNDSLVYSFQTNITSLSEEVKLFETKLNEFESFRTVFNLFNHSEFDNSLYINNIDSLKISNFNETFNGSIDRTLIPTALYVEQMIDYKSIKLGTDMNQAYPGDMGKSLDDAVFVMETEIEENSELINNIGSDLINHSDSITFLNVKTDTLSEDTSNLDLRVTSNGTSISILSNSISGISENTINISTNTGDIANNTGSISKNETDITANTSAINTFSSRISKNETDIISLSGNIGSISDNTTKIDDNTTKIDENTTEITTNTNKITTHETTISGHSTTISANSLNITNNRSEINNAATLIGVNTEEIGHIENLATVDKTNLTSAINELHAQVQTLAVLKSPNGNSFIISVADDGTLSATQI